MKCELMKCELKENILTVFDKKMTTKGSAARPFYAFFANKNDNPALLVEAAIWRIQTHKLDHFEKADKIKQMVEQGL